MNQGASLQRLAREAKAIVALAFRNGPIEDLHAGKVCPTCAGKPGYTHITQNEMKRIMQNAVDHVYQLLSLKENDPEKYEAMIELDRNIRVPGMSRWEWRRIRWGGVIVLDYFVHVDSHPVQSGAPRHRQSYAQASSATMARWYP